MMTVQDYMRFVRDGAEDGELFWEPVRFDLLNQRTTA